MSSEKFESLDDDFTSILDSLRERIERKIPNYSGEERKTAIRHAERNMEEANIIYQEMEEEAKVAPISARTQMLSKLRNYRREMDQLNRSMKKATTSSFGVSDTYGFERNDRAEASQRAKLMEGTQILNRTTDSIARSHQISAETDQIGVDTIDELGRQRDVLERTRDRLVDTDTNLSRSRKILKTMAMRVMTNKMILIVVILLELGILGVVVWWKFFKK
ncbi:vesicle transport through interaction with t-SNAREs homolog 1B-like isoform X2 [Ostrea edulis]|uniref:vesicle transport through interaction with t-SNAREs homolog 1B-like isoform X2 n=1 Tax=Ostrea edulis TaxID=37623 RepID=UPI0024AF73D6|nr:vesicle transport through interaction with t-SNAREs homolog 1B-like isoform X2 [Ostrea edulis]